MLLVLSLPCESSVVRPAIRSSRSCLVLARRHLSCLRRLARVSVAVLLRSGWCFLFCVDLFCVTFHAPSRVGPSWLRHVSIGRVRHDCVGRRSPPSLWLMIEAVTSRSLVVAFLARTLSALLSRRTTLFGWMVVHVPVFAHCLFVAYVSALPDSALFSMAVE